jgi:hypothetical protein
MLRLFRYDEQVNSAYMSGSLPRVKLSHLLDNHELRARVTGKRVVVSGVMYRSRRLVNVCRDSVQAARRLQLKLEAAVIGYTDNGSLLQCNIIESCVVPRANVDERPWMELISGRNVPLL